MIDYLGMVRQFHEKYGHLILNKPRIPMIATVVLRRKLIEEEAKEFDHAASIGDLIEIADALGDLLVVIYGTALSFGIPIEAVFTEIHRSNMTKSTEKNEYGKTIKGENYEPPDIKKILEEAMK